MISVNNLYAQCNCQDYLFVNDPTEDLVHKFLIDPNNGSISTATEVGNPWLAANIINNPHGVEADLNGNMYISQLDYDNVADNELFKISCTGQVIQTDVIPNWLPITNMKIIDNILYSNQQDPFGAVFYSSIDAYDLCDFSLVSSCPLPDNEINWGLVSDFDNNLYITTNWFDYNPNPDNSHRVLRFDPATCTYTEIINLPNTDGNIKPMGLDFDEFGNIYFVVTNYLAAPLFSTIYKFDPNGNLINSVVDNTLDNSGFAATWGIVYNEVTQTLYAGTQFEDCIAVFNTGGEFGNLTFQPALGIGYEVNTYSKAINILRECCPPTNLTVDTALCSNVAIGSKLYLQDLVNCSGIVCEGAWIEAIGNDAGIVYNSCDNSITLNAIACGTYTIDSDGTAANAQCGAFSLEVNVCYSLSSPAISVVDNDCAANTPGSFTVTTPCSAGNTIEWSTDNGVTWSAVTPTYDNTNPLLVVARCVSDSCESEISNALTSSPEECCPPVNCIRQFGEFAIIKRIP